MKLKTLSLFTMLSLSGLSLTGCGGGGTIGNDNNNNNGQSSPTWQLGQFDPSDNFKDQCENKRTGTDPFENKPYPD